MPCIGNNPTVVFGKGVVAGPRSTEGVAQDLVAREDTFEFLGNVVGCQGGNRSSEGVARDKYCHLFPHHACASSKGSINHSTEMQSEVMGLQCNLRSLSIFSDLIGVEVKVL